jgi:tetratricopeptide (TPR) repeat protein
LGGRRLLHAVLVAAAIGSLLVTPSRAVSGPGDSDPSYLYRRGMARWADGQPLLAMDDFDRVLELRPGDVSARVSRAELRLALRDRAGAVDDLDAAARSAPRRDDVRLTLGDLYTRLGRFEPAVAQYDLWIAGHPEGARAAAAFKARCWARGLWGRELKRALSDCNTAWRLKPDTAGLLDSRALVEFRLGKLAESIGDYDRALRSEPKNAWLLYARGVAKLRAGRKAAGEADIAAAQAQQPLISEVGRQRGVAP